MTETTCAQWRAGCFNLVIGMGEASGHHDGHLAGQPITDHYKDSHLSCESKMTRDRSIHKYCNIRTLNQTLESGHCIKQCLLLGNIIWLEQDLVGWCFQPSQPQRIKKKFPLLFTTVLSQWDLSRGKFRLLSQGKASCDRVALPS